VELFLSTFVNRVDRKGRVSVPATFRSTLATHRQPNLVVLIPSFKVEALDGTGSDHLAEMMEGLKTLDQYSERRDDMALVFADSRPLTLDGEGRIILPEDLKEHAHITDEVAFVGLGAMFQLWDPSRFAEHRAAARERVRAEGATLPSGGGSRVQ
jgi:MraZ protein